jgi:hypothetical protein
VIPNVRGNPAYCTARFLSLSVAAPLYKTTVLRALWKESSRPREAREKALASLRCDVVFEHSDNAKWRARLHSHGTRVEVSVMEVEERVYQMFVDDRDLYDRI